MSKIKARKDKLHKYTSDISDLQKDRTTLEHTPISPVDFYNKFVRKEGMRILTEEEYQEIIRQANNPILSRLRQNRK